jgi:DNA-binding transcriptional MerR regulator
MRVYSLRTLTEIVGVTPRFVKRLEEAELIFPIKEGSEFLYTEDEIRKICLAKDLREMGVNFAGIEVILDISDRLLMMRERANRILRDLLPSVDENNLNELLPYTDEDKSIGKYRR